MQNSGTDPVSLPELEAFADGELPAEDARRVAAALETDADLRAQFAEICRLGAALEQVADDPEDDDPAIGVLANRLERQLVLRRRAQLSRYGAAAAAVVAAVGTAGWYSHAALSPAVPGAAPAVMAANTVDPGALPSFVADAAGAHSIFAFDSVHPVEFTSSDQPVMHDWFVSHLGGNASVPQLDSLGFTLVGGRLLGGAEGAMAQILYENAKGDRVSLIYGKRQLPGGPEVKLVKVGKSFASYWQHNDFSWAVVEDAPGADVTAVSAHVAELIKASN